MKLLDKDPSKRPGSGDEVAEALRRLRPGTVVVSVPRADGATPWAGIDEDDRTAVSSKAAVATRRAESRTKPRSPAKWIVAAALLLLIGGGFAAYQLIFKTKNGTLTVEVDGDAKVLFEKGELHILDDSGSGLHSQAER